MSALKETLKNVPWLFIAARSLYRTAQLLPEVVRFERDRAAFKKLSEEIGEKRFPVRRVNDYPCLLDRLSTTPFDPHYTYHPAWAARILAATKPEKHVDISSTLKFCTVVSAFIPIDFYDYRPANLHLRGLACGAADLSKLPFEDNSISSLSCMHTIEHVGLGRYGDPLNPRGDLEAMAELSRVLAPGGNLLVVVPTGRPHVDYNAHRVYSPRQVREGFPKLSLREFTLIPEQAAAYPAEETWLREPSDEVAEEHDYGCGCYWFTKEGTA